MKKINELNTDTSKVSQTKKEQIAELEEMLKSVKKTAEIIERAAARKKNTTK